MDNSSLGHRLSSLSAAKRALLELKLTERDVNDSGGRAIPVRKDRTAAPLSFAQQRLWFLNQLEPESPNYNEAKAIRMRGSLDVGALQTALERIVGRHEVLRTTICSSGGTPLQVVREPQAIELPLIDLQTKSGDERETEAQAILLEAARRPFDLSRDLMLRALLVRLKEHEHILLLVTHHVASDGWSSAILWRELAEFYQASVSGRVCRLGELPIQYQDYAEWQRNWLQGEVLDVQLAYWRQQLDGIASLQLPADRRRNSGGKSPDATRSVVLPKDLAEALKALSRKQAVTLFMTLLAAFQTLLHHYTRQEDIVIGTPIAGRTRVEFENLIGFFVNTLVLRTNFVGNPSFLELLGRVREVALGAYAHQDVPFEKLVEELQPERKPNHSPLFQVMFAFQNLNREVAEIPTLTTDAVKMDLGSAKFDLSLAVYDEPEGLRTLIEYNTDLFYPTTIERMLSHYRTLLEGVVANSERRISELPILTQDEKQQLLVEWNDTDQPYPSDKCIHELFEAQVEKSPGAVAVAFEQQTLTYEELNTRANRLAHYLTKLGVGPDVLVGICLERSLAVPVALLAILKAGGAYVPLDPAYPQDRLAFMLKDSQATVLITQEGSAAGLTKDSRSKPVLSPAEGIEDSDPLGLTEFAARSSSIDPRVKVVWLDRESSRIDQESAENLANQATPENLAYVIYTSGSTGAPKGVLITHRGVVNHNLAVAHLFELTPRDRVAQCSTLSFDIAVEELFPTWISGATVVLCPRDIFFPNGDFLRWVAKEEISLLDLPTAFWHDLVRDLEQTEAAFPENLRLVVVGGEKASAGTFAIWQRITREQIRWVNGYGPTESTVATIFYEPPVRQETLNEMPIGRPIANTQAYILDRYLRPVPVGIVGEVYIGGEGLARGYLNRPELTAEKFIADPSNHRPGSRLYKTGDLARYLADGNIEFIGRDDLQIKLRGYRVELGEIETTLTQHSAVHNAIVLAQQDAAGTQRLAAYVVLNRGASATQTDLRAFLRERLPEFMVPAVFVILESLPLTPSGKIDRRALPDLGYQRPDLEEPFVTPRTPLESRIAEIWAEVLGVNNVGVHDNFFDLGGHSLKATQVMSRLRQAFHLELPLRGLFEHPTVAGLAATIVESQNPEPEYLADMLDELEALSGDETRRLLMSANESGS